MSTQAEHQWHALPAEDAAKLLDTSLVHGLTNDEAHVRISRDGRNVITQSRGQPWWLRLLQQLHTPLVYILLVAAV
ncbi:MAG: cation-transporting P-type ATPase, partial [Planctomycetota bacterium]|nr:cation-transporting P-type ATPase [Planctomycetota bacterium]